MATNNSGGIPTTKLRAKGHSSTLILAIWSSNGTLCDPNHARYITNGFSSITRNDAMATKIQVHGIGIRRPHRHLYTGRSPTQRSTSSQSPFFFLVKNWLTGEARTWKKPYEELEWEAFRQRFITTFNAEHILRALEGKLHTTTQKF